MALKKKLKRIKKELLRREKESRRKVSKLSIVYTKNIYDAQDCFCTDNQNRFKELYPTEYEAQKRVKFLLDEQGVYLSIYPCRYSYGWHLTKG